MDSKHTAHDYHLKANKNCMRGADSDWIFIRERIPSESDGTVETESDGFRFIRIIAHVTCDCGQKMSMVREVVIPLPVDLEKLCIKFDMWQPEPALKA